MLSSRTMVYCWKCGTEVRDDSAFCHKCGATLRVSPGDQGRAGFELLRDDKTVQDHWLRRVVAFVIDAVIVSVLVTALAVAIATPFLIGGVLLPTPALAFPGWWGIWFGGLIPFIILLYFVLAEAIYGRTLGKEIMGLRVERVDGKPMDLWTSLVRNMSKIHIILLILDLAGGLGMRGEMSQKFSDRYIGTKVATATKMTLLR